MFFGRYCLWPIWIFRVADMVLVVASIILLWLISLWPIWFVTDMVALLSCFMAEMKLRYFTLLFSLSVILCQILDFDQTVATCWRYK